MGCHHLLSHRFSVCFLVLAERTGALGQIPYDNPPLPLFTATYFMILRKFLNLAEAWFSRV